MRVVLICLSLLALCQPGGATEASATWAEQKCRTYAAAWEQALVGFGSDQMNYAFIAANENFIAGGCTGPADVCPRSLEEIEVANVLTLAMMNAGAASTFLPFRCPRPDNAPGGWTGPGL